MYFLFCVLNEILIYFFYQSPFLSQYVNIVFDLFTLAELAFFFRYYFVISDNPQVKRYIPVVFVFFCLFQVTDYLFLRKKESFNSISAGIEAILIITLCIYYFYEQLKKPSTVLVYTQQSFWIIIAFLIFQCGTFFLYLYAENSLHNQVFRVQYSVINSACTLFKNILFSIAMVKKAETPLPTEFPNDSFLSDWNSIQSLENVN